MASNLTRVEHRVDRNKRYERNGHFGAVVWLTGLSGAGKSTLAAGLEGRLFDAGYAAYLLDGDNLRHGLNSDLGFSANALRENIRRAGEVAALLADAGLVCIAAFISPFAQDRANARVAAGNRPFFEIHVCAPLAICELRDPKGLYRRARRGEIPEFTGIDSPYEAPSAPDLRIHTDSLPIEACVDHLLDFVVQRLADAVR